jgi:hypothetical protein
MMASSKSAKCSAGRRQLNPADGEAVTWSYGASFTTPAD